MNDRQRVEFDLPKPVWFELATIAQKRDTTVAALIADAIKATVVGEQTRIADRDRNRDQIVALVKTGMTDLDIAARLGVDRVRVCTVRRNARLPHQHDH